MNVQTREALSFRVSESEMHTKLRPTIKAQTRVSTRPELGQRVEAKAGRAKSRKSAAKSHHVRIPLYNFYIMLYHLQPKSLLVVNSLPSKLMPSIFSPSMRATADIEPRGHTRHRS